MVLLLTTTPAIKAALDSYYSSHKSASCTSDSVSNGELVPVDSPCISRANLLFLSRKTNTPLHILTRNTSVYTQPAAPAQPKTPEYLALMAKLRRQQEETEYYDLLGGAANSRALGYDAATGDDELTPGQQIKVVREQITTIFNIAISGAAVAYAAWYWSAVYANWSVARRTLLAVFAFLLTVLAEVVVYLGYLRRVEDAKLKERKLKEKKEVLNSVELQNASADNEKVVSLDFSNLNEGESFTSSAQTSNSDNTRNRM